MLPAIDRNWALFLDVDGTLLDIVAQPDAVVVPPRLRQNLATLSRRLGGALALVSGRAIADLDRIFTPLLLPASGQHGSELRRAANAPIQTIPPAADLAPLRARLEAFATQFPGVLVEFKGRSIAVHYRNAPEAKDALAIAIDEALTAYPQLEAMPAHCAFDIKPRNASKRVAVEWFMADRPFAGRVPVFIGDDVTDESGFAAALGQHGHAIRVGLDGDSLAALRAGSPAELRRWLADSAAAMRVIS